MSCIITFKGKKYSEEQFKEYFINNKQEFATSIAKNKDVIDSFKRKMEGIDFVFSQSPELASVGSKAQYLQYLSTIFPNSKVKDIVTHVTQEYNKDSILKQGYNPLEVDDAIVYRANKKNPLTYFAPLKGYYAESFKEYSRQGEKNYKFYNLINVKKREQIILGDKEPYLNIPVEYVVEGIKSKDVHILGSKQDIQGFGNFVNNKSVSLQQKFQLNESDIKQATEQTVKQSISKIQNSEIKLWSFIREKSISELLSDLSDYIQKTIQREGKERFVSWVDSGQSNTNIDRISNKTLEQLWNDRQRNFGDFSVGLGLYVIQKLTDANSEFTGLRKSIEKQFGNRDNILIDVINVDKVNKDEFISATKDKLQINPYKLAYHFRNAPSLNHIINDVESLLLEEHIHMVNFNMLTKKDEQDILNEMSSITKSKVRELYPDILSETELVHEYLRMIVQDMLTGRTTELVQNFNNSVIAFLRKVFSFIKNAFNKLPDTSITKQKVNEIYNYINNTSVVQEKSTFEIDYENLNLTPEVIDKLYSDSSQRLSKENFTFEARKLITLYQHNDISNNEIINRLKCL